MFLKSNASDIPLRTQKFTDKKDFLKSAVNTDEFLLCSDQRIKKELKAFETKLWF